MQAAEDLRAKMLHAQGCHGGAHAEVYIDKPCMRDRATLEAA